MKIAVDFDGTCVDHRYPEVGPDVPLAVDTLKDLVEAGHKIILYTMRSGKALEDAIEWFRHNEIHLFSVGRYPGQHRWSLSNKCHADICIDDRNLGCPMVAVKGFKRRCVDWREVRQELLPEDWNK